MLWSSRMSPTQTLSPRSLQSAEPSHQKVRLDFCLKRFLAEPGGDQAKMPLCSMELHQKAGGPQIAGFRGFGDWKSMV